MAEKDEVTEEKVYKILIVDDETDILKALSWTLERAEEFKCKVSTAIDGITAMAVFDKEEFDVVLADFKMPVMSGVALLAKVKEKYPLAIRMLITGYSDMSIAKEAINKAHVYNFITKPWNNKELKLTIFEALKRKSEREAGGMTEIDEVAEALRLVNELREHVLSEQKLMFSFTAIPELNKFSFEIKKMKNVHIKDFHVFDKKYIMSVVILPELFDYIP